MNAACTAPAGQDIDGNFSLSHIHNPAAMLKGRYKACSRLVAPDFKRLSESMINGLLDG